MLDISCYRFTFETASYKGSRERKAKIDILMINKEILI